jgi:hypothetical protein
MELSDRRSKDFQIQEPRRPAVRWSDWLGRINLTMKLQDTLETVAWGEEHFGSVTTGGPLRKRDVDAAIRKGLVVEVGAVTLCDGDGFTIHPERYRTGYRLTAAGRRQVRPNT